MVAKDRQPLLNYSTKVPPSKSISEIHDALRRGGARAIMTEYDDEGEASGVAFSIIVADQQRSFTLPVRHDAVKKVLEQHRHSKLTSTQKAYLETSIKRPEWVAWRVLKDWVEAQMAIVATEQVTLTQVMLPYMRVGTDKTLYEAFEERHFALPEAE